MIDPPVTAVVNDQCKKCPRRFEIKVYGNGNLDTADYNMTFWMQKHLERNHPESESK